MQKELSTVRLFEGISASLRPRSGGSAPLLLNAGVVPALAGYGLKRV